MAVDNKQNDVLDALRARNIEFKKALANDRGSDTPGQADVFAVVPGAFLPIEIKFCRKSFAFSQWADDQRKWAEWMLNEYGVVTHLAIIAGQHPTNYNPERYNPRRIWVIPFTEYLAIESEIISYGRKSLPYRAPRTQKGRDMISMFDNQWAMEYVEGSGFVIPDRMRYVANGTLNKYPKIKKLENGDG